MIENAGLTEWPVPLLGRFDAAFLDVPEETREQLQVGMPGGFIAAVSGAEQQRRPADAMPFESRFDEAVRAQAVKVSPNCLVG